MSFEQALLIALLVGVCGLFAWGRWRYDVVAFAALVIATLLGAVPYHEMFSGFGHPATVTVALVLIASRGLRNSGAAEIVASRLLPPIRSPSRQVGLFTAVGGALSTVMNNVGALALLMPAALQSAARASHAPALILMPLSFGSILGGLVTLIGTPPNIIVAAFRGETLGTPFGMFDFTPVGSVAAVAGIAFVSLIGWRLIPRARRQRMSARDLFDVDSYVSEASVPSRSKSAGQSLAELDEVAAEKDAVILRLIRRNKRIDGPDRKQEIRVGDVLVIEAGSKALDAVLSALDVRPPSRPSNAKRLIGSGGTVSTEAVVLPRSRVEGRTRESLRLRRRFGVNLLAVSRRGHAFRGRLRSFRFQAGDILLFEGDPERLDSVISALGCLPLASRTTTPASPRPAVVTIALFASAIAAAAAGLVSLPAALAAAVVAMVMLTIVPLRDLYESIDWPVVVLIGAMIPIGGALEESGATAQIVNALIALAAGWPAEVLLVVLLVATMTLSDVINNAATAVVMAPIAMATAEQLGADPDAFLMAVAIGASCAFLTPIGHQNNTLILGPGGYEFGDYWRLGLPLEILIVVVAIPMLMWVWPLYP